MFPRRRGYAARDYQTIIGHNSGREARDETAPMAASPGRARAPDRDSTTRAGRRRARRRPLLVAACFRPGSPASRARPANGRPGSPRATGGPPQTATGARRGRSCRGTWSPILAHLPTRRGRRGPRARGPRPPKGPRGLGRSARGGARPRSPIIPLLWKKAARRTENGGVVTREGGR